MSIVGLGLIPPIDPKAAGGLFSLAEPDDLRELLVRAGFDDVRIEEMEFHLRFSDFEDYWIFIREFAGVVAILLQNGPGLRSPRSVRERACFLTLRAPGRTRTCASGSGGRRSIL
jgi:hypothetical protein